MRPRTAFGEQLDAATRCAKASGKRMYASESMAMLVVERSLTNKRWRNRHGQPATGCYECPHCGWWHLTHKRKGGK